MSKNSLYHQSGDLNLTTQMTSQFLLLWFVILLVVFPCFSIILHRNPIQLSSYHELLEIRNLQGTLFTETLSQLRNVSRLKIFESRVENIEPGALCAGSKLKSLELNFGGNEDAPVLTKSCFSNCQHELKELVLVFDYDNPSRLEFDALEDLFALQRLVIRRQHLRVLSQDVLKLHGQNLEGLVLSNCYINTIGASFFDNTWKLNELEISYNRNLTNLPGGLFSKSLGLKRLVLSYNRLKSLQWEVFAGLKVLERLDLSGNRIANFDGQQFARNLPNLREVTIYKNLVSCRRKNLFKDELNRFSTVSVSVIYTPCRLLTF